MANLLSKAASVVLTASRQLISGALINGISAQLYSAGALTAATTQTQAAAIANALISTAAVEVTTGNAGDGVALPPGYAGLEVFIANLSANNLQVYGSGTDTINGVAYGTGVTQTASKHAIYKCTSVSSGVAKWQRVLSA